jgi:hypothetical protein
MQRDGETERRQIGGFVRQAPQLLQTLRATGSTDGLRNAIVDLHAINALLSPTAGPKP